MSTETRPQPRPEPPVFNPEVNLFGHIHSLFRGGLQIIGVVILLIGLYYGLSVLGVVLSAATNPEVLEQRVAKMATLLQLEGVQFEINEQKIPYGRTIAMGALILWNLLALWIPLALIRVGGQLVWGPMSERQAMFSAMEEFLRTTRDYRR